MFSTDAQTAIERAKDVGFTRGNEQLTLHAVATALAVDRRASAMLAEALSTEESLLQQHFQPPAPLSHCESRMPLAEEVRDMLATARAMIKVVPWGQNSALIGMPHLVCATARTLSDCDLATGMTPPNNESAVALLVKWAEEETQPASLGELTRRLRTIRQDLISRVHGQDHAVHQFVDGLFNAEVVSSADVSRRKPAALFVFAGPPGVGKTYLAELGSTHLDRPFQTIRHECVLARP